MRLTHPDPAPRQLDDVLPTRKLVLIGVVTLLIFGVGVLWSWWIWARGGEGDSAMGPGRIPRGLGRPEIGLVFQQTFDQLPGGQALREQAEHQLRTYGWVDRKKELVHVPIGVAIDRYLEARPQ
ncbi:MAG: hypothetical protein HY901_06505 [Deltaproteobacteria bacterium]|nr:hypothetical protein [Deltaproteobacteria bacterium]